MSEGAVLRVLMGAVTVAGKDGCSVGESGDEWECISVMLRKLAKDVDALPDWVKLRCGRCEDAMNRMSLAPVYDIAGDSFGIAQLCRRCGHHTTIFVGDWDLFCGEWWLDLRFRAILCGGEAGG